MSEQRLISIIPNADDVLSLEPEELAGAVLQWLNSLDTEIIDLGTFLGTVAADYGSRHRDRIVMAGMEAGAWLEREGLLVRYPRSPGHHFISRRGKKLVSQTDVAAYRHADMLPKRILHPTIAQRVYASFLRGAYDIAVLEAFREVEIQVRKAGAFAATDFGVALMRRAFEINNGPLINQTAIQSERQAESDLFAGAIGLFKNPASHRAVTLAAEEAVEQIMLASHLLRIVDARI